jgi:choline-sulfatase
MTYSLLKIRNFMVVALLAIAHSIAIAAKPNIMFIIADDQAYETIGAYGLTEVKTPNLDKLLAQGTSFTHCYNMGAWNGAVCMASRAMLNSGCFVNRAQAGINQHPRWSELMRGAGYQTYMTGKWHVPGTPRFDVVKDVRPGMPNQTKEGYNRPKDKADYDAGWKPWETKYDGFWKGGRHWTNIVADNTEEFFGKVKESEKPFFMYLAFNAPHDPRQAPKEYVDMYPVDDIKMPVNFLPEYPYADAICGKGLRDERLMPYPRTDFAVKINRQEYYAIITHMDHHIGRMLDALEKSGRKDNTIIIFTADHGLSVGHHGLVGKQNMYEHSMRVPFIVTGPGVPKGKNLDMPIYLQDAMATSLELAGVKKPEHVEFKSVMPLIRGERTTQYDRIYGKYINSQRMIKRGDWKLIFYPRAEKKMRLFNCKDDPHEMKDLIDNPEYASLAKELKAEFLELQKEMADGLDVDNPATKPQEKKGKTLKPQKTAANVAKLPKLNATVKTSAPPTGGSATKHHVKTVLDRDLGTKYYNAIVKFPVTFTFDLNDGAKKAKSYTIQSGNDMPGRDPKSWEFLGSDDGKTWTSLDKQADQAFTTRHQARTFKIKNGKAFRSYQLKVTGSAVNANGVQFCEFGIDFE